MSSPLETPQGQAAIDNRRATGRIIAYEALSMVAAMARSFDCDVIELIVFSGIWTSNTAHLIGETGRYVTLHDVPPDMQRRPITRQVLYETIVIPERIAAPYVDSLIARHLVEEGPNGLTVPSAVFTRPEMLDGTNEVYTRLVRMITALRAVGFGFGEPR